MGNNDGAGGGKEPGERTDGEKVSEVGGWKEMGNDDGVGAEVIGVQHCGLFSVIRACAVVHCSFEKLPIIPFKAGHEKLLKFDKRETF